MSRRTAITAGLGTIAGSRTSHSSLSRAPKHPFILSLNTSTIMGQKLPIPQVVELVANAGFKGIEPWIREIDEYVKGGGSLSDLRKRIHDGGLKVVSAIGFFDWIVDDSTRRMKALDDAKRNMEMVAAIGGTHLAAPPTGATDISGFDLIKAAERYRALLEAGESIGVFAQAEVWGFSKTLGRLSEAVMVAVESGHPKACVLPDVYHLYKGGSPFGGLKLVRGDLMHNFHLNDYPADPPRASITDAQRVLPGDGIAPLTQVFRDLKMIGYKGALSVEVFNRDLWTQDPKLVLEKAYRKLDDVVQRAFA